MIPLFQVKLFDQISPLPSVEPSDNVQSFVIKRQSGMEVPPCVQISYLRPRICCNIVNFALVHALRWKTRADSEDLGLLLFDQNTSEGVCSPFKQHVSPLH